LGKQVIEILTSKKEQYKRFALGVGLPTFQSFYESENANDTEDFYAWPRGNHVRLEIVHKIHKNAHSRIRIPGYKEFRAMLYTIGNQLINRDEDKSRDRISEKEVIYRIQAQYDLLKNDDRHRLE
jgi:hypothetical protein